MNCNICITEKATVHLTQIEQGKAVESMSIHLCTKCAAEMGVNDPAGFSLADLLTAVRASKQADAKLQD